VVRKHVVDGDSNCCVSLFASLVCDVHDKPWAELTATATEIAADSEIPKPQGFRISPISVECDCSKDSGVKYGRRDVLWEFGQ